MENNIYLKVDGVNGECEEAGHEKWIDIISFDWGVFQPGNMSVGGGGGAGKANFDDLTVIAAVDKATPALLKYCSSGKHINEITLSVCKAGGSALEYIKIKLKEVLITNVTYIGIIRRPTVGMKYSFQAAEFQIEYVEQTELGTKGASSLSGWNIKENREI